MKQKKKLTRLVMCALFSALIVVMTFTPYLGYITVGVIEITTLHAVVIFGAAVLGPAMGAVLGGVWGLTCIHLLNNDEYKRACLENGWKTDSGKYFKTSAETAFRFCANSNEFEEEHTALSDAEIESFLFGEAVKRNKGKFDFGIVFFPFRELGAVEAF